MSDSCRLSLEEIEDLIENLKKKPESYCFCCSGGGTFPIVNFRFFDREEIKCRFAGDDNWLTPICKECSGNLVGEKNLSEKGDFV